MAFSMFLRSSACVNRRFGQQVIKLATQPSLIQHRSASLLARGLLVKQPNSTPIMNLARSFRTSPLLRAGAKDDHSKLWVVEKMVSVALIPLLPLALLMPNKLFDCVLAILITAHSFWGLEAIVVDYARASVIGPFLPKVAIVLVYLISVATLGGLFYLISHDVGLANSFRQLWAIKSGSENKA